MPKDKALELECPHCSAAYSLETVQTTDDRLVRAVCRCCAKEVSIRNGRIVMDARDVGGHMLYE